MYYIEIASLVSGIIGLTIILCGVISDEDWLKGLGAVWLVLNLIVHVAFQAGAEWQRDDWQTKYNLTPKPQIQCKTITN